MTKRNNLIIPSIIVSVTLLIISGISLFIYYNLELRKQTLQSNQNSKNIEESDNQDDKKNESQNINENTEIILLNFKIDSKNTLDIYKIPYEAVLNNPNEACQSIIAAKNTRNHSFYMFEDSVISLEEKYDQYRKLIPYIDNNLISQNKILQIIKDLCIASGYNIN